MPKLTPTGLWRNADFTKLWTGKTISAFGWVVTRTALDLTAVITLGVSCAPRCFWVSWAASWERFGCSYRRSVRWLNIPKSIVRLSETIS